MERLTLSDLTRSTVVNAPLMPKIVGLAIANAAWYVDSSTTSASASSSVSWHVTPGPVLLRPGMPHPITPSPITPSPITPDPGVPPLVPDRAIAFIDRNVENYQLLLAGMKPDTEVWLLDATLDGMAQVTQVLANKQNITNVSVFSHATDGNLQLGGSNLTLSNVLSYSTALSQWKSSLTENADVMLYGCNFAATEQGQQLVQQISQWTGADIAASTDFTGNAALNGDWILEYTTGAIEALEILQPWAKAAYQHLLATFTVINNADSGAGSLRQAILDANGAAGADTIVFGGTMADQTADTINLTSSQLTITDEVAILGTSANLLTVSGNNARRVFQINPGITATIADMTIASGRADAGAGVLNNGGSAGLIRVNFNNNVANSGNQLGGAVLNAGGMLVNGGAFNSNTANSGGGIYNLGGLEVRNTNFNFNRGNSSGGGIFNAGGASLLSDNNFFSRNTAGGSGGGIHNSGGGTATILTNVIADGSAGTIGGGITNFGTMTIDNTLIRGNRVTSGGGAGAGVFNGANATVEILNTSILGNASTGVGGGIFNNSGGTILVRANSLISSNRASDGGGILNNGTARIGGSTVISNRRTTFSSEGSDLRGAFISEGDNTIGYNAGSTGFPANNALSDSIIFPSY
jgi:Domain of unknown function (DUF4347)